MRDEKIIDAKFEVIEPGRNSPTHSRATPSDFTLRLSYTVVAIVFAVALIWARPFGTHLMGVLFFGER